MTTNISFSDLKSIIQSPEVEDFKKKMEATLEDYNNFIICDNKIAYNYCNIMKYFLKDEKAELNIKLPIIEDRARYSGGIQLPKVPITSYSPMSLKISAKGICLNAGHTNWGDISVHRFSNTKKPEHGSRAFSYLFFNDDIIYNVVYPYLNEYGQETITRLKELHNAFAPEPFMEKSFRYTINNISLEEKELLNIRSQNAALFFKLTSNGIFFGISNDGSPYGEPYPTAKLIRLLDDNNPNRGSEYVLEKVFLVKHYDDIMKGLKLFDRHRMPAIQIHKEYLNAATKLSEKYVMLDKF